MFAFFAIAPPSINHCLCVFCLFRRLEIYRKRLSMTYTPFLGLLPRTEFAFKGNHCVHLVLVYTALFSRLWCISVPSQSVLTFPPFDMFCLNGSQWFPSCRFSTLHWGLRGCIRYPVAVRTPCRHQARNQWPRLYSVHFSPSCRNLLVPLQTNVTLD